MSDKSFQSLLEKDLHNAESLAALLQREREQLASRDIDALNTILMEKAQLLADIERNDDSRRKMLASFGHSADNQALGDYCNKSGFGTLYEELQRRLKTCAELTDINGAIVHRSRLSNRHVLDIIQGKSAHASVYTSQGGTNKQTETRAIAKA
jgi:flagella synthesis protein FlgN